jgi:hypothetical protein
MRHDQGWIEERQRTFFVDDEKRKKSDYGLRQKETLRRDENKRRIYLYIYLLFVSK